MVKVQTYLLLIYIEYLLRKKGFKYACETIRKKKKKNSRKFRIIESDEIILICSKINNIIDGSIIFPKAECLHKSLVGYYLLSKKGLDVNFFLGVSSDQGFASHAWLEFNGIVINDNKEFVEKFNPLMKF